MEQNNTLGLHFYIYATGEIFLSFIGIFLLTRGINYIALIMLFQIIGHIGITIEGIKTGKYELYRLFMGAAVPFIVLSGILWLNTF